MHIIRRPQDIDRPVYATIGMFDGVHRGHRSLIDMVLAKAHAHGAAPAAITFGEHPREILHPETHIPLLSTFDEKMQLLEQAGLQYAIVFDFTPHIAGLSARDFLALLARQYHLKGLIIGYDHRFGHNRSDGIDEYKAYGHQYGIEVLQAPRYMIDGETVSSSAVREALLQNNVAKANMMLGYRYSFGGTVVTGHKLGRSLGFPTANIAFDNRCKLIPPPGVYAVTARLDDGTRHGGMMNVGYRPTVPGDENLSIEVHLFDFRGDLYGRNINVSLVDFMRHEQRYDSLASLRDHLAQDAARARHIIAADAAR